MGFRSMVLVALWTLLSGPVLSSSGTISMTPTDRLMASPGLKEALTPKAPVPASPRR